MLVFRNLLTAKMAIFCHFLAENPLKNQKSTSMTRFFVLFHQQDIYDTRKTHQDNVKQYRLTGINF